MWGIGFSLVVARNGNLLKRLVAAPVAAGPSAGGAVAVAVDLPRPGSGSAAPVRLLCAGRAAARVARCCWRAYRSLGALAFSGLGLLAAARPRTIEGVSGIMNLVMVPMWIFSGIFFSTERFPAAMQPFVQALPLTALNDALRGVMLRGHRPRAAAARNGDPRACGDGKFRPGLEVLPLAVVPVDRERGVLKLPRSCRFFPSRSPPRPHQPRVSRPIPATWPPWCPGTEQHRFLHCFAAVARQQGASMCRTLPRQSSARG